MNMTTTVFRSKGQRYEASNENTAQHSANSNPEMGLKSRKRQTSPPAAAPLSVAPPTLPTSSLNWSARSTTKRPHPYSIQSPVLHTPFHPLATAIHANHRICVLRPHLFPLLNDSQGCDAPPSFNH